MNKKKHPRVKGIPVRCTAEEREKIKVLAAEKNLSASRYLLESGLAGGGMKESSPELREERERAEFHVRQIGRNLNQLTARMNAGTGVAYERLLDCLQQVGRALDVLTGVWSEKGDGDGRLDQFTDAAARGGFMADALGSDAEVAGDYSDLSFDAEDHSEDQ